MCLLDEGLLSMGLLLILEVVPPLIVLIVGLSD